MQCASVDLHSCPCEWAGLMFGWSVDLWWSDVIILIKFLFVSALCLIKIHIFLKTAAHCSFYAPIINLDTFTVDCISSLNAAEISSLLAVWWSFPWCPLDGSSVSLRYIQKLFLWIFLLIFVSFTCFCANDISQKR